jgi:hypothetical protein
MAQMPIQFHAGRADPYTGALPGVRPAMSYPVDRSDVSGGISGGLLRPGAVDQAKFKEYLAAARAQSPIASPSAPARAPEPRIPTLTPAQLAALGVDLGVDLGAPAQVPAKAPALDLSAGYLLDSVPAVQSGSTAATGDPAAPEAAPDPAPATVAQTGVGKTGVAQTGVAQTDGAGRPGPIPRSRMGADGVWELPRLPDKDEREMLRGQKWRIVEDPEARELFLGPDGEFGWDDFVDLINPLQHIPLINIAYRAVTGDEIYGAARMVDFAFGPVAGASTAIDLAFRDVTGKSIAGNAVAALFGDEAETHEQWAARFETAAGGTQLADASTARRGSNR